MGTNVKLVLLIFHLFAGINLKSGQQGIFPSMYGYKCQTGFY